MNYRNAYIKYVESVINPGSFNSIEDYRFYCNIKSIIEFDFLDIELSKEICEKRWVDFFKNQKLLVSCTQNRN